MTATVLPDRLERFLRPEFKLRNGAGKGINGEADVCVMQAVAWLAGEASFTETPDCACPVITRFCIRLNDSWLFSDNYRNLLKPFAPRLIGTRSTSTIHKQRARLACDYAVRVFVPIRLRALKRDQWASELEALDPITNATSAKSAKLATARIRGAADAAAAANAAAAAYADAAAYAAAYAYADAAAYAAAYAYAAAAANAAAYADADAAAAAAADAAAAAAAAADAAAAAAAAAYAAAAAAAAADELRAKSLECLDRMILINEEA